MKKVTAHAIDHETWASLKGEIVAIEGRLGHLRIEVHELQGSRRVEVSFSTVEGFRVLEERDLGDFWPTCSSPNGWLYEITEGGWLSQELERPGSITARTIAGLREFFIAGVDDCVNILSLTNPEIKFIEPSNEVQFG